MADVDDARAELIRVVEAERAAKDEAFRLSPYSPLPDEARDASPGSPTTRSTPRIGSRASA